MVMDNSPVFFAAVRWLEAGTIFYCICSKAIEAGSPESHSQKQSWALNVVLVKPEFCEDLM